MTASGQTTSNTCLFVVGPRSGQTQQYPGYPAIPLGSACHDGLGSYGFAVKDGQQPIGQFSISNGVPTCTDIVHVPVRYKPNDLIPKSGLATMDEFGPVIYLRSAQLPSFSRPVLDFLYAHECGHHARGQVRAAAMYGVFIGPELEQAADCFAINELKRLQLLNEESTSSILSFLGQIPADSANYPGPQRVQRIKQCLVK
jgi:hypothetical protein